MIAEPHEYTAAELKYKAEFDLAADDNKRTYWNLDKIETLRTRAKRYYVDAQGGRCCYCRRIIPDGSLAECELEHVAPRTLHPQFTFEPRNLVVSCIGCNKAKGQKPTLRRDRKRYPKTAAPFLIFHPHFDDYGAHIRVYLDVLYAPLSEKGQKTIEVCGLLRFHRTFAGIDVDLLDSSFDADLTICLRASNRSERRAAAFNIALKILAANRSL